MNRTLIATTAFCALSLMPHAAFACGGFFCSSSPIDQAGETIVYGIEGDGTLTMAIQIQYSGNDDDFAWILPVPAPPTISIGSDALFDELRRTTEPTFVTREDTRGVCRPHPSCVSSTGCMSVSESGCGGGGPTMTDPWMGSFVDASSGGADGGIAFDSGPPDTGVTVFSEGPIGPYETVVLGAATGAEVITWLSENGYDIPDTSSELLDSYAAAGQIFVALRLRSNLETRIVRPVVLRMPTAEACLPIRLTAIATVPGMPITAFFLGSERMTSINYSTAIVEPDDIAFWEGGRTWASAVATEVERLDGQAFSTDYAGPTPAINLDVPSIDDLATQTDPAVYIRALGDRGYRADTRLLELLEGYIVPPATYAEATDYYNCLFLGSTLECGEPQSFDPAGLTAQATAEITVPRSEATALINRHRYLTRLYTTMDAEDMTVDPVFIPDTGLGDQDNVYTAARVTECDADHYREDAPVHWLINGTEIPDRVGTPANDSGYCRMLGGFLPEEAPMCDREPVDDGSWLCMAAGTAPIQGGMFFGLGLLLFARRLRRRR